MIREASEDSDSACRKPRASGDDPLIGGDAHVLKG